jgi:hypothetical protein
MTQFCRAVSTRKLFSFYVSLPFSQFSELHKLAQNLASVFGSIYTCEQVISHMKQNKLRFCSRTTYVQLHDVMWVGILNMEPNVTSVVEQRQAQVSH